MTTSYLYLWTLGIASVSQSDVHEFESILTRSFILFVLQIFTYQKIRYKMARFCSPLGKNLTLNLKVLFCFFSTLLFINFFASTFSNEISYVTKVRWEWHARLGQFSAKKLLLKILHHIFAKARKTQCINQEKVLPSKTC